MFQRENIIIGGARVLTYSAERPRNVVASAAPIALPPSAMLDVLPPLQQHQGTCFAFSLMQATYMASVRDGIALPAISAPWLDWYSRYRDNGGNETATQAWGCSGSYTASAIVAAQHYGFATEFALPSTPENYNRPPPALVSVGADDRRIDIAGVRQCRTTDEMAHAIAVDRAAPMVSLATYSEVLDNDGTKLLTGARNYLGGHVWTVVGYDTVKGDRVWHLQTSWGECGRDGFGLYLASEHYMSRAMDAWAIVRLALRSGAA